MPDQPNYNWDLKITSEQNLPTAGEVEDFIRKKKLSPEDAQATRMDYDQRVFDAKRTAAKQEHPLLAKLGAPVAAALNYGAGAAPGVAALASLATAPITAANRGVGLADAAQLNRAQAERMLGAHPAAATLGKIASIVAPTASGGIARAGFQASGGWLAKRAAQQSGLGRVLATQIASAFAGGAGAITALNAANAPGDLATGEKDLGQILTETAKQVTSPLNVGLSVGLGSAAAIPRAVADPRTRELIERAKVLMPGFKETPDMLRGAQSWTAGLIDSLSKSSAGRAAAVQWMGKHFYAPLTESLAQLRASYGVATDAQAVAAKESGASAVRNLLPTIEQPIGGLARKREIAGNAIGASSATVPAGPMAGIVNAIDKLEARHEAQWRSAGNNSAEFSQWKKGVREVLSRVQTGEQAPVAVLENWRQSLGELAGFEKSLAGGSKGLGAVVNPRDVREAKVLYRVVRETLRRADPGIDSALQDIAQLRSSERALSQIANVANLGTDRELLKQVAVAPNFTRRWATLTQSLPADRVQALRGDYLAEFLQDAAIHRGFASSPQKALNVRSMNEMWSGRSGPQFSTERFDAILPGIRRELLDRGEISDLVMRSGVGRAEGSATAPRQDYENVTNAAIQVASDVAGIQREPGAMGKALDVLLGMAGRLALSQGILNGRLSRYLNNAATGVPSAANSVATPAITAGGGPLAALQALVTAGAGGAQAGVGGLQSLSDLRARLGAQRQENPQ